MDASPSAFAKFLMPNKKSKSHLYYKGKYIPPEVASRNSESPFLFKCCQVDVIKEGTGLEIRKGEYVGKTVTRDVFDNTAADEDPDYNNTLVDIYTDETDLPG